MSFKIVYDPDAKNEVIYFGTTYSIRDELQRWQEQLAAEAAAGVDSASLNLTELLDELIDRGTTILDEKSEVSSWKLSWERFKKVPLARKLQAVWVVVRRRRPPWELRMAVEGFYLLGTIPHDLIALYAVDRTKRQVKFLKFELGEQLGPEKR